MNINQWKALGKTYTINGKELFVIDQGKAAKTLVILHGYPTSSYDFWKVLPELTKEYRVIIHDHLGFGYSAKPMDYSYSLVEQADYALALWQAMGLKEVSILAHDYGTSVATEILAKQEFGYDLLKIKKLILCNGSVHIELAKLRFIQKLLRIKQLGPLVSRLSNQHIFIINMRRIWADPSTISRQELQEMWRLLEYNEGKKVFHKISNYPNERYTFWHRWIGALERTDIPTGIIWGKEDPVARAAIAEQLHKEIPNNKLAWLEGVGHYPMLEAPSRWVREVLDFLE